MHEFRLECIRAAGRYIADESFCLIRNGKPIALVPLVLHRGEDQTDIVASYMSAPLPLPMIAHGLSDRATVLTVLLDQLEERLRAAKVTNVQVMLASAETSEKHKVEFADLTRKRGFIDCSYESHCLQIDDGTLDNVRERYRRDIRKYSPSYMMSIIGPSELFAGLAKTYMDLHVKDSGKLSRPLSTYEKQVEMVLNKEAFWVIAKNIAADRTVGMLLVSLMKSAAYDNSVAVDPEYARQPVSHLMKWCAIQHLQRLGVKQYELGRRAALPRYDWLPTDKNYGISFFKDGWCRGKVKSVQCAEKFYSRASFARFWSRREQEIANHYGLA